MTSTPKIIPLSKELHLKAKINNKNLLDHAKNEHILPVVVHEFVSAGAEFPIVFIKVNETFRPVIMLGLEANQNLYIKDGMWDAHYVPRSIRNYPFVLVKESPESDKLLVGIDESSPQIGTEEGVAIFNEDGTDSDFFKATQQQMVDYIEMGKVTHAFVTKLQELGLLTEQTLTLKINEDERRINGIYLIDENKFAEISDEVFLELRKTGYLNAIYAQLMSLQHTAKVISRVAKSVK